MMVGGPDGPGTLPRPGALSTVTDSGQRYNKVWMWVRFEIYHTVRRLQHRRSVNRYGYSGALRATVSIPVYTTSLLAFLSFEEKHAFAAETFVAMHGNEPPAICIEPLQRASF